MRIGRMVDGVAAATCGPTFQGAKLSREAGRVQELNAPRVERREQRQINVALGLRRGLNRVMK